MIRPDLLKAVTDALASHRYLTVSDFTVREYSNKEKQPCLAIEYRYDINMSFSFHIPAQRTRRSRDDLQEAYRFSCTVRPGRESAEEVIVAEERSGLLSEIRDWLRRLHDDVVSAPAVRQLSDHAAAIDQLRERLSQIPNERFSRPDVAAIDEVLERLKAETAERLKRDTEDKDELRVRVDVLTRDVEFLKKALESMTKRQWAELLATRLDSWKGRLNLKQLSAGARVLKVMMGSGDPLDSIAEAIDGIADAVDKTTDSSGA